MDELLARQTPHSVEAEQAVIGAILLIPLVCPRWWSCSSPMIFIWKQIG